MRKRQRKERGENDVQKKKSEEISNTEKDLLPGRKIITKQNNRHT